MVQELKEHLDASNIEMSDEQVEDFVGEIIDETSKATTSSSSKAGILNKYDNNNLKSTAKKSNPDMPRVIDGKPVYEAYDN